MKKIKKKTASFGRTADEYLQYGERGIQRRIEAGDMTPDDAELIRQFVAELQARNDISAVRSYKVVNTLSNVSRFFKTPFREETLSDFYAGVAALKAADRTLQGNMDKEGKLSPNTLQDYVKQAKRFFIWMCEKKYCLSINPEDIRKVKNPKGNKLTKKPDMMLSEEEISSLIRAASTVGEKALISVLYESAMRCHEVGLLKWSDVSFENKYFVRVSTAGKTGQPRFIPLVSSRQYLISWMNEYEATYGTPQKEELVFRTLRGTPYTYNYLRTRLLKVAAAAGIKKKITPHIFRHSRITNLIRQGASQSSVSMLAWGTPSSDMMQTYLHMVGSDVEREIAKINGIQIDESGKEESAFKPHVCPRCMTVNAPEIHFCKQCGAPLDDAAAHDLQSAQEEIRSDKLYLQIIQDLQARVEMLESMQPQAKGSTT